ncbi:MAG: exosortase-associated EpsI family protein [Opitutaceae bacterium]
MKSRWVLIVAAAVLIAGGALQFMRPRDMSGGDQARPAQPVELKQRIPASLAGWTVRDEPLGPNESVRSAVERTLNYDDHVYRLYRRNGVTVGVYVAYWAPSRMPVQKVASHTPDRCWTENGWTCLESRFHETVTTPGTTLRAAQWRLFRAPGAGEQREYVLYWHLVGPRLYDYGERFNASPGLLRWWREAVAYALAGSQEQYFIRLTSSLPFERLAGEPGWQELLGALARLGLAAKSAT